MIGTNVLQLVPGRKEYMVLYGQFLYFTFSIWLPPPTLISAFLITFLLAQMLEVVS